MRPVRINRVTARSTPQDTARVERVTKRALELLGRQLALGDAVAPRPRIALDVTVEAGISDEQMARKIARELAARLV
jgi:predicted nucleic acid-binding protein